MKIIRTISEIKEELNKAKEKSIGYVPTMGFLHEGHLSLVEKARAENDIVVMSIFVNPLQFGPNEDFEQYPRDEEHDKTLAEQAGVDLLFVPTVDVMYPEEVGIELSVSKGTDMLCGRSRPGHFDGVATVLTKFFHIVNPNRVYFGLKDAQQFSVVHTLISQLNFPIELVGLPTVRESDGLAKSSRNVYLSEAERKEATVLYRALQAGREQLTNGIKESQSLVAEVKEYINEHTNAKIDYVELLSYPTLNKINIIDEQIILAVAVQYDHARLIDNIILSPNGEQIDTIIK
ncbi:MAG TPA: pantoate--beta-alanine ligase [Pseudogracilibacillus sp.]|nr:pantoate--beta-alanine ligase [Pseudogracilibacillus sp.]